MYIYLDESGDLGFDFAKTKTTEKFVVTLLVCDSREASRSMEKAIKRTLKKLNKPKDKSRRIVELKGTQTKLDTKEYFYRQIRRDDWGIYSIILNKKRVFDNLRTKDTKSRLYNFVARLLLEKVPLEKAKANVRLVVDRSKNRAEIRDFNQYLRNQIESRLPLNTSFEIEHVGSHECKGIQAVDLFCWGLFRKYESNDSEWYMTFGAKIRDETHYLP